MMNISYVVLSILIISIGISECSNETSIVPSERVASNCYFCSNCPRPFNPYASTVSQVYSSTGWCTMMSRDSSPDGVYTRGVAVPGLCTYNGCAWRMYNGVNTWICCCNQNLCNGASIATTTYRPAGNTCHFCSTCPLPFNRYSSLVRDTYSPNGWCTKMSTSSSPNAIATRGADPGVCAYSGCSWKTYNGVNTYICCCRTYHCNTGMSTKKSTIGLLSAALTMMFVARKHL